MSERMRQGSPGFTLVELLVVTALICAISAIAVPAFSAYREKSSLRVVMVEIGGMIREAKQRALIDGKDYAVGFNAASGRISLISDRGKDGKWNSDDDRVVRAFRLADRGKGLSFGYGKCGPLPGLAKSTDGITFQTSKSAVCNPDLTGNAGTVYVSARCGAAMALVLNSTDFSYKLWQWNGKKWVLL